MRDSSFEHASQNRERRRRAYTSTGVASVGRGPMPSGWSDRDAAVVEHRFGSLLAAARESGTSVRLDHISELMPKAGPDGAGQVVEWLEAHPSVGTLVGDRVVAGPLPPEWESAERRARGYRYLREAERIVEGPLSSIRNQTRCVAVTGSAAYGEPSEDDDLDFLVVTRRGAVWPFLVFTYLAARMGHMGRGPRNPPHWCFNYVLDEREARREFAGAHGFLFAREALMARPVAGATFYRGLVGEAGWLADEVPRLYNTWKAGGLPPLPPEAPAPAGIRVLNAILYPVVAGYLTLVAMVRNQRYRRRGEAARCFRVVAGPSRLTYETARFEALREMYRLSSLRDSAGGR
jgi:hypothetical protein